MADQDHSRVPMAVAAGLRGGRHQAFDLGRRQVLAGAFRCIRSSRADSGPQVLPPARATVPPWLPAKSARVSNLLACCALGPVACAAPCSCRREPCTGHLAWPPRGMADPFAWIEHRSGGALALTSASRRARRRSLGSRSRSRGSLLIFDHSPAVAPPGPSLPCRPRQPLARLL
jgi:hypothetical protein